jgi:hypothetical protein
MKQLTPVRLLCLASLVSVIHGQTRVDLSTQSRNVDFSGAASTKPAKTGIILPVLCSVGEQFLKTDGLPGQNLYACNSPNTWTMVGNFAAPANVNRILSNDGVNPSWRQAGAGIVASSSQFSVDGAIIPRLDANNYWTGRNQFKELIASGTGVTFDASTAAITKPFAGGTAPSGTCTAYQVSITLQGDLYRCANGVWSILTSGSGSSTPTQLVDTSGYATVVTANGTGTIVNQVTVRNAAASAAPQIQATGTDTNIDLRLLPKGTGQLALGTASLKFPNADGTSGQVLQTNGAGGLSWTTPATGGGMTNPMTTAEDLLKGGAGGTPTRLAIGTNGQCLTVSGGAMNWGPCGTSLPAISSSTANAFLGNDGTSASWLYLSMVRDTLGNPALKTTAVTNAVNQVTVAPAAASGSPQIQATGTDSNIDLKLVPKGTGQVSLGSAALKFPNADGTNGQFLQTNGSGSLSWSTPTASLSNPMTTAEDLLKGGVNGAPARLPVGVSGQCLTVAGGAISWGSCGSGNLPAISSSTSNAFLSNDGTSAAWSYLSMVRDTLGNPALKTTAVTNAVNQVTVAPASASGSPQIQATGTDSNIDLKLVPKGTGQVSLGSAALKFPNADGTSGQVLQTNGSGSLSWSTPAASLSNPMTTAEDLLKGGVNGTPTRLAIGTNGQCLTVSGGAMNWGPCGTSLPAISSSTANAFLGNDGTSASWSYLSTLRDTLGNPALKTTAVTNAVNQVTVAPAAASASPQIQATGTDSNIDLKLVPKGTGQVSLGSAALKFPNADGTSGQVLSTNGSGQLQWSTSGGGGGVTIQGNGVDFTVRSKLNFVGRSLPVADSATSTNVGIDPASMVYDYDDFLGGSESSSTFDKLGWTATSGASHTIVAGHPGVLRLTATNNTQYLSLGSSVAGRTMDPSGYFDAVFLVRANDGADANTKIRIGFTSKPGYDPPDDGLYLEKLGTDTNWFAQNRVYGASGTRVDTSVAVGNGWLAVRIYRANAGTIKYRVASTLAGLLTAPDIANSSTITTVAFSPFVQIVSTTASSKTLDVDYIDLIVTGLNR